MTSREVAQAREVVRDVRFCQLGFDDAKLVLKNGKGLVQGTHETGGPPDGLSLGRARLGLLRVAALEALDAATGVDELLLAGEERVALVAQFYAQWGLVDSVTKVLPHEQVTVASPYWG